MSEKRWWTRREMLRMLLLTALLWMCFVASLGGLHNGDVALVFLLGIVGSKTYIFGQMFLWIRDDWRDIDRTWELTSAALDRIEADLDRRDDEL